MLYQIMKLFDHLNIHSKFFPHFLHQDDVDGLESFPGFPLVGILCRDNKCWVDVCGSEINEKEFEFHTE